MSSPRYDWWGYVKGMIRRYPDLRQRYRDLHEPSVTAGMSGVPGGGGPSRGTEDIAIRELPATQQREYEAVRRAILTTRAMQDGPWRMQLVDALYWARTVRLREADLMGLGYSYRTARRINRDFVYQVAKNYGLLDEIGPQRPDGRVIIEL